MIWRTVARVSGSNARATVTSPSRISAVSTLVASISSSSFSLSAIDDERALRGHERDFAHVNLFFLCAFFLAQLERDVQWCAVCLAFALRLERAQFRLANFIVTEIEYCFFIIALDREDLLE